MRCDHTRSVKSKILSKTKRHLYRKIEACKTASFFIGISDSRQELYKIRGGK